MLESGLQPGGKLQIPITELRVGSKMDVAIAADETIEVARTVEEVSALRGVWPAGGLNTDIDFFLQFSSRVMF